MFALDGGHLGYAESSERRLGLIRGRYDLELFRSDIAFGLETMTRRPEHGSPEENHHHLRCNRGDYTPTMSDAFPTR